MALTDIIPPWALDAGKDNKPTYTGRDLRDLLAAVLKPGDSPVSAKPGILRGLEVKDNGQGVTVEPGYCVISTLDGSFLTGVRHPVTLPIAAPHVTFSRIDLVVAVINDSTESDRGMNLEIVQGSPASSPTVPQTPAKSLTIAEIDVSPTGERSITTGNHTLLAGSFEPETFVLKNGKGVSSGVIERLSLPGRVAVLNVAVIASGESGILADTGISGVTQFTLMGSATQMWWCGLSGDGFLMVYGDTPKAGDALSGTLVITVPEG